MHVMMDIETLGTKPGCVVMQVALVRFDHERVYPHGRVWNMDVKDQLAAGLEIDQDTLQWWRDQDEGARAQVLTPNINRYRLRAALADIDNVLELELSNERFMLWAKPDWFDLPMLAALYQVDGGNHPWPRRQTACARTFFWAAGLTHGLQTKPTEPHYAIRDAEAQAFDVVRAAKTLGVDLR